MKKVKLLFSILTISVVILLGNAYFGTDSCVYAQDTPCAQNGYKNWNSWWWHPDGVDCWCNPQDNVVNQCEDSDPGQSG